MVQDTVSCTVFSQRLRTRRPIQEYADICLPSARMSHTSLIGEGGSSLYWKSPKGLQAKSAPFGLGPAMVYMRRSLIHDACRPVAGFPNDHIESTVPIYVAGRSD